MSLSKALLASTGLLGVVSALNPNCAPGGNFDLSKWSLQLPIGSAGHPTTISSGQLQGCGGYQDPGHKYFFTETGDGALVMKVPGSPANSGCVTTPNSQHCRTEFRESNPSSWSPNNSNNKLTVTLSVPQPDNSGHGTVIGQIHIDDSVSSKPVAELFYNSGGVLALGVEQTRAGGNEIVTPVGKTIPVGTQFTYTISYSKNVLSVSINGGAAKVFSTYSLNAPPSYFKVGNYNQGSSPSSVHVFAINVSH